MTAPTNIDHYNLLGVTREATRDEIRGAYKVKALALHPDKNPNGEAVFKLMVNAYQTLISPSKKCAYDRELDLKESRRPAYGAPPPRPRDQARPTPGYRRASDPGKDQPTSGRGPTTDENRPSGQAEKPPNPKATPGGFHSEYRREPHVPPPAEDHGSFADWFRRKQEEFRKAEELSRAKAEYAKQLEDEEREKAEAYRKLQRERERERDQEIEQERERRRREQEHLHKEQENRQREERARATQARMSEFYDQQKQQQTVLEGHMTDLAREREELRIRREKLAADKRAAELAGQMSDNTDFKMKQKLREEEIAEELRRAEVKAKEVREMYARRKLDEDRIAQQREAQRRKEEEDRAEQEEQYRRDASRAAAEEAAKEAEMAKQKSAFGQQRRRVMDDVLAERRKHDEEMAAMRRETDRIEAEMRAKLEALRAAKREGRAVNAEDFKL